MIEHNFKPCKNCCIDTGGGSCEARWTCHDVAWTIEKRDKEIARLKDMVLEGPLKEELIAAKRKVGEQAKIIKFIEGQLNGLYDFLDDNQLWIGDDLLKSITNQIELILRKSKERRGRDDIQT